MTNILINATAAKEGGALTIFNQLCASKVHDENNFYILLSPIKPISPPKNYKWIKKSTNSFSTLFFTLFTSWFYAKFYHCSELVSLSNVNTIFPCKKKVTYFHNLLIILGEGHKFSILRFIIRFIFQKNSIYIFQTSYVKDVFVKTFNFIPQNKVLWPGIDVQSKVLKREFGAIVKENGYRLIVPITNTDYHHKNFNLVVEYARKLVDQNVLFYITSDTLPCNLPDNIISCGSLSRDDFIALIGVSDGVIITSEYETLCLPIFEALLQDKPAFVLSRDYVEGLQNTFGNMEGLLVFNDYHSLYNQIKSSKLINKKFSKLEYSQGQWDF